jgi:hypothetical protein
MEVKTQTIKDGFPVILEVKGNGCFATLHHPKLGAISGFGKWAKIKEQAGVLISNAKINNKRGRVCIGIPETDWLIVDFEIKRLEAIRAAEEKAAEEDRKNKALVECPAGHTIARCLWTNGDLMSGEYEDETGAKVIGPDMLENHHGWYFLPAELFDKARKKMEAAKAAEAKKAAIRAERAIQRERDRKNFNVEIIKRSHRAGGEGGPDPFAKVKIVDSKTGESGIFTCRNIFDFGYVVNPEAGGLAIDVESFIAHNIDTEEKKEAFRKDHPTNTGWGWNRGFGDKPNWVPMTDFEIRAVAYLYAFSPIGTGIRM